MWDVRIMFLELLMDEGATDEKRQTIDGKT